MSGWDVAVIGAGVNGLTCAAYLAKAGRRVVVLERAGVVGGLAVGDEFHPGFRSCGLFHDTAALLPEVVETLALEKHGLERAATPSRVYLPEIDGPGLVLHHEADVAAEEIARHAPADAAAYADYRAFFSRTGKLMRDLLGEPPPDLGGNGDLLRMAGKGWALRRLGKKDMLELLRVGPMCVADWLNERFESELLKSGLALPAIRGGFFGPWSPGTQANLLRHEAMTGRPAAGGPQAVVDALEAAARSQGVEIRVGAEAEGIRVGSEGVEGVLLAGGEAIDAPVVAASCDPKTTFLRLLPPASVAPKLAHRVSVYRSAGTTAKVNLAISGALRFAGRPEMRLERARTGGTLDDLERAFDAVKYGRFSEAPALEILVPTVGCPDWAPPDHQVVSILAHFAPWALRDGWTDEARERLGDVVTARLDLFAPGVRDAVVAREVLAPPDIARRYGTSGGHVHHGDHALDQLFVRPVPECARYATPVRGLYLCGSGSHPGGGITGAPGALAAGAVRAG